MRGRLPPQFLACFGKVEFYISTFLRCKAFFGPKMPNRLNIVKSNWTKRKAWDCSPNHLFWKKGWGLQSHANLGRSQLTGSEQRCQKFLTSLVRHFCYKIGKTKKGCKKSGGNWPRSHMYVYVYVYVYVDLYKEVPLGPIIALHNFIYSKQLPWLCEKLLHYRLGFELFPRSM